MYYHLRRHYPGEYPCQFPRCAYVAGEKHTLDKHVNNVHRVRPFMANEEAMCDQCDKTFASASNLRSHMATQHATPEVVMCDNCSKTFLGAQNLLRHQRKFCKPLNIHVCPYPGCGWTTPNAAQMRRHVAATHTRSNQVRSFASIIGLEEYQNIDQKEVENIIPMDRSCKTNYTPRPPRTPLAELAG